MAVVHLNNSAKAESSVKVSGIDAKKVSAILIDETKKIAKDNLTFLKSVTKYLKNYKSVPDYFPQNYVHNEL